MQQIVTKAAIALGSNLPSGVGGSTITLQTALDRLRAAGLQPLAVSRFFATPAWPPGSGPEFVNAAAVLDVTSRTPGDVLATLHRIEAALGRERVERWGPRAIDLDLLTWGDSVLPDEQTLSHWINLDPDRQRTEAPEQLVLPHPRLHERAFVLVPLADVAPDWQHPVLGETVTRMLEALDPKSLDGIRPLEQS